MKFGFSEQALYCPCLCLLIYELVEEISHLSLFISFLQVIIFFLSLSFSLCGVQLSLKSSMTCKDRRVIEK